MAHGHGPQTDKQTDDAIANVRDLGSAASQKDRDIAAEASRQAGSRGQRAREAFGNS